MNTSQDFPSHGTQGADASPSGGHDGFGPRRTGHDVRDISRMRRTVGGQRNIAGVCGGLAKHFDIDPLIVRVVFVVLIFFGGAGLLAYGAAWLLVPSETEQRAIVSVDDRSRTVALAVVAGIGALLIMGDSWGGFGFPWPLAVIGLAVAWLVTRSQRRDTEQEPGVSLSKDGPAAYRSGQQGGELPGNGPAGAQQWTPASGPAQQPQVHSDAQPWNDRHQFTPPPAVPAPRKRPRKPGPILFLWTLALIALALGTVGIVDLAGVDVAASAYPATALAISGLMLLVGAFYGRAGGIILVALLAAAGTAGATAADKWDPEDTRHAPTSAADVRDSYSIETGKLVVDLSDVADPARLDGRTIDVSAGLGQVVVVVPDRLDVDWTADVGAGNVIRPGGLGEQGGVDFTDDGTYDVPRELGTLTVNTSVDLGAIEFETAA